MRGLEVVNIRLVNEPMLYSAENLNTPREVVDFMRKQLSQYDREVFCILNLTTSGGVINMSVVSMGTLNETIISSREVFKSSILSNAAGIIAFHNHPSGRAKPSIEDLYVTKKLMVAGKYLDIPLMDHIIVGGMTGEAYSFLQEGYMDKRELDKKIMQTEAERYEQER